MSEGALIRAANGPLYQIRGGRRVWISSFEELAAAGLDSAQATPVEDRVLGSLPLAIQDGMLVRTAGERVYLVENGQRRWVRTAEVLEDCAARLAQ